MNYITNDEKETIISYLCSAIEDIENDNDHATSKLQELIGVIEDGLECYDK